MIAGVRMTWPTNDQLMQFHYECLQGVYFNELLSTSGGQLLFSSNIEDEYYNFYGASGRSTVEDILSTGDEFRRRGRKVAAYVGPEWTDLASELHDAKFTIVGTDSWLGIDADSADTPAVPDGVSIRYVHQGDRQQYVDAFKDAYTGDEASDDPYGDLEPGYAEALYKSFESDPNGYDVKYVEAVHGNKVVGVAMVAVKDAVAGIYGLGVRKNERHEGLGKAIMDTIAQDASRSGAQCIFLQTESASPVEHWYIGFGYHHLFNSNYFVAGQANQPVE